MTGRKLVQHSFQLVLCTVGTQSVCGQVVFTESVHVQYGTFPPLMICLMGRLLWVGQSPRTRTLRGLLLDVTRLVRTLLWSLLLSLSFRWLYNFSAHFWMGLDIIPFLLCMHHLFFSLDYVDRFSEFCMKSLI